ncbi:hypothetical protein QL374_003577 [Salmonella enterica]|nr:hypothetical protein [Salmonella enterica]ELW6563235.1 hypothetical protein [Salmonella enterica]ELZ1404454.1 hypothetical protein [Salmonella enterica]
MTAQIAAYGRLVVDPQIALNTYTSHAKYIRCVAAGGMRYDLNGEPCGGSDRNSHKTRYRKV